jgi:hypothetical protein
MPIQKPIFAIALLVIGIALAVSFGGLAFVGATPTQHASHSVVSHYRV